MAIFDKLKRKISKPKQEKQTQKTVKPKTAKVKSDNKTKIQKREKPSKRKKVETDAKSKDKTSVAKAADYYRVLTNPHITEKSTEITRHNQYVFEVASGANKTEISAAIKAIFGIKPVKVNIINLKGKLIRFGKHTGQRTGIKKAIVTLPKGKSLDIYEGV